MTLQQQRNTIQSEALIFMLSPSLTSFISTLKQCFIHKFS